MARRLAALALLACVALGGSTQAVTTATASTTSPSPSVIPPPSPKNPVPVPVPSVPSTLPISIATSDTPCRLSGTVVDAQDRPVPNATVTLGDATVSSDAHGHFVFDDLGPGDFALSATAGPLVAEIELTLSPGERLDGLILALSPDDRGHLTGDPIEDTPASTTPADSNEPDGTPEPHRRQITFNFVDDRGAPLPLDSFVIFHEHGGSGFGSSAPSIGATFSLADDVRQVCPSVRSFVADCIMLHGGDETVVVRFRAGATVIGVVRGGQPGERVACGSDDTSTDARGHFRVTCPPGQSTLEIGDEPSHRLVSLATRPGATTYVELHR